MKYSGSQRGMMIYGFILKSEVKLEYWSGHGSRIIVPSESVSILSYLVYLHYIFIYLFIYFFLLGKCHIILQFCSSNG